VVGGEERVLSMDECRPGRIVDETPKKELGDGWMWKCGTERPMHPVDVHVHVRVCKVNGMCKFLPQETICRDATGRLGSVR
jgi:hypothetical protein